MKPYKIILIYRRRNQKNGWRVEFEGEPSVFATGHTRAIAISNLILYHPDVFRIDVKDIDPK